MYLDICMFVRTCLKIGRYFGGREMLVWWSPTCFFANLGLHQKSKKWYSWMRRSCFCTLGRSVRNSSCWKVCFSNRVVQCFLHFLCPLALGIAAFVCFEAVRLSFFFGGAVGKLFYCVRASCFFAASPGGLDLLAGWLGRFGFGLFLCSFGCVFMFGSCDFTKTFCSRTGLMTSRMVHDAALTLCQGEGAQLLRRVERHRLKERARNVVLITQPDIALSLEVVICLSDWIHVAAFACLKSVQDSERRAQWQNKTQTKIFRVFEIVHFFLDLLLPLHGRDPSVHVAWFVLRFKNFKKFEQSKSCCQTQGLAFSRSFLWWWSLLFNLCLNGYVSFAASPRRQSANHTHTPKQTSSAGGRCLKNRRFSSPPDLYSK